SEEGRSTAQALINRAGIVIEGFRPGVMERLGLGPDDLDETVLGRLVAVGHANRLAIENATQGAALPSPICASIDIFPVKDHVEINEVEL
ncbi:hypothetical protein LCGC14_1124360, partial [marine sediment metagenome]